MLKTAKELVGIREFCSIVFKMGIIFYWPMGRSTFSTGAKSIEKFYLSKNTITLFKNTLLQLKVLHTSPSVSSICKISSNLNCYIYAVKCTLFPSEM